MSRFAIAVLTLVGACVWAVALFTHWDTSAPPAVECSISEIPGFFKMLASSFARGFSEADGARVASALSEVGASRGRAFSFKGVEFQGRTYRELSFYVSRPDDSTCRICVRCYDDLEFKRIMIEEFQRVGRATCGK